MSVGKMQHPPPSGMWDAECTNPSPGLRPPSPRSAGRGALETTHGESPSPLRERGRRCREAADEGALPRNAQPATRNAPSPLLPDGRDRIEPGGGVGGV